MSDSTIDKLAQDTPRTDAEEVYYSEIVTGRDGGLYWVKADFARQLEREVNHFVVLTEQLREVERLKHRYELAVERFENDQQYIKKLESSQSSDARSEQEPVAWRWKSTDALSQPFGDWHYADTAPTHDTAAQIEPLYGHPWAHSASSEEATAWLIEMPAAQWGTGFYWRGPRPGWSWGTIDEAVRFSRKNDAERVIAELQAEDRNARRKIAYEACEHSWPPYVEQKS